ncbi:MAG: hypothetical protein MI740_18915 [Halanaerobiales bacterium]|nr:hypothetical protein [Halanaerobiales bacterium]
MSYVYHFTKKENLKQIINEGLKTFSNYNKLGSKIREQAIYAWLLPSDDKMGYLKNERYVCLELEVDPQKCVVANMDWISSAYVNLIGAGGQPKDINTMRTLVYYYDNFCVPINKYINGLFRVPEVIINENIEPKYIRVHNGDDRGIYNLKFKDNTQTYEKRIEEKLSNLIDVDLSSKYEKIKYLLEKDIINRVAVHDDSSGLLISYVIKNSQEYFTISLGNDKPGLLLEGVEVL